MSYEDSKNRSIAVSVGVQAATELAKGYDNPSEAFHDIVDKVVETVINLQAAHALVDALPGSTIVPSGIIPNATPYTAAPQPAYTAPAAPVAAPAPAPIPGATDGDPELHRRWVMFFGDPTAWYDNRFDPGKPKGAPDFKHKQLKDAAGKYNLGLWVEGKGNPSYVKQALQQAGL